MVKTRKPAKSAKDVYQKVDDLPEVKKKAYNSILEDFDRQVASRIEQMNSAVEALQKQVTSQFRVAKVRLPKAVREDKAENYYYNENDEEEAIESKLNMTVELAKVAVEISKEVSNDVKNNVKSSTTKAKRTRASKKNSSILSHGPSLTSTGVRKSTRKRTTSTGFPETPLASSTLTAAALGITSTAIKPTSRARGMITPKFDPATPLTKTAMRTQRPDEKFLVSMNGSPVYVAKGKAKAKDNVIPLPIGGGKTLIVPADNPEVQPYLQKLIKTCMGIMNNEKS